MARAGLTAERVTEAAAELADEVGFDNITISALARRFGVKDASLYSHVKNVQDLRTRVAVLAARDFAERITAAIAGRAGKDALTAFAHAYRTFAMEHPGRYAATQMEISPEVLARSPGHLSLIQAPPAMLRAYGLAEPDLTDAVRLLRSTFHGYVVLEASAAFRHPRQVRTSWERGLYALHVALENWPPSAPRLEDRPREGV
ncbi:TetR/AcrR family transcriptional regulator [Sphaerimonospora cavernae]|uniref:TetR/AcrR family transcriptional regulator n=1 Tax=Sphaerimonospora cavernae TaxID=1740611 RepID=A0ABV6UDE5_9ACTN